MSSILRNYSASEQEEGQRTSSGEESGSYEKTDQRDHTMLKIYKELKEKEEKEKKDKKEKKLKKTVVKSQQGQ